MARVGVVVGVRSGGAVDRRETRVAVRGAVRRRSSAATAFEAAAITPWPSAAFNTGDGRTRVRVSPFPAVASTSYPRWARSSRARARADQEGRSAVSKETVLGSASTAMRRAGWQPPPPLVAVEVAAHAERTAAGAGAGERAAPRPQRTAAAGGGAHSAGSAMPPVYGQMGALAGDPGSAAAAQAAALAALAPMMAAAAAAEQANLAAQANLATSRWRRRAARARTKRRRGARRARRATTEPRLETPPSRAERRIRRIRMRTRRTHIRNAKEQKDKTTNSEDETDDDDRYTVAGIMLASRALQIVWAKLPGTRFWPGIKVNLDPGTKDVVPRRRWRCAKSTSRW